MTRDPRPRGVCTKCHLEAQRAVDPYPQLAGTPKQAVWAAQIRYRQAKAWRVECETRPELEPALSVLDTQLSARWWIDHRISSLDIVSRELAMQGLDTPAMVC